MNPFEPVNLDDQPNIGFRVECHNKSSMYFNRTFYDKAIMVPRGPHLINGSIPETLDAYLSWKHQPTPFIALFDSWERALRWRTWLNDQQGVTDVVILAVWLRGKPRVYNAWKVARALGYSPSRLDHHQGEFLFYGGISAHEHRVLACFSADVPGAYPVPLSLLFGSKHDVTLQALMPPDFFLSSGGIPPTMMLGFYMFKGLRADPQDVETFGLVFSLCGLRWTFTDEGLEHITIRILGHAPKHIRDYDYHFKAVFTRSKVPGNWEKSFLA